MTMLRWRTETWVFIIWNVVMAGLLWLVLSPDVWLGSSCDELPYGSSRTACAMGAGLGGAFMLMLGFLAIALAWPIGAIVIGIAWWKGRGGAQGR